MNWIQFVQFNISHKCIQNYNNHHVFAAYISPCIFMLSINDDSKGHPQTEHSKYSVLNKGHSEYSISIRRSPNILIATMAIRKPAVLSAKILEF